MRIFKTRQDFTNLQNSGNPNIFAGTICTITDEPANPMYTYQNNNWSSVVTAETNPLTGKVELSFDARKSSVINGHQKQRYQFPVIERFNSVSDWTIVNSGSGVAQAKSGGVFGANCINFSNPAGGGVNYHITQDQTIDMSSVDGMWMLLRSNVRKPTAGLGMTIYLSHLAALAGGAGRFQTTAYPPGGSVSLQPVWVPKTGFSVLDGSPNFSNPILSWRFRVDTNAEANDFDLVGVMFGKQRPCVVISFDDGWDTSYSVGHVQARKREIPLTHYLIGSLLDRTDINYITTAQALEMAGQGDYIGLHGANPWDANTSLIASDKAALDAKLGSAFECKHASYPEGKIGNGTAWMSTKQALVDVGCETARLAGLTGSPTLAGYGDSMALTSYALNNTTSLAQAQAAIDTAIMSGGTVMLYGHKIAGAADALTWTTSDYTSLLDYIVTKRNAGLIDCKTIKQWHDDANSV